MEMDKMEKWSPGLDLNLYYCQQILPGFISPSLIDMIEEPRDIFTPFQMITL